MEDNVTTAIASKTMPTMIIQATTMKCIPINLVIMNEPFYLDSAGGETLATISTVTLFFYILLSILLYHSRSCRQKRDTIQIFLTRREKILNAVYWMFLGVFEIVCIYGSSMKQDQNNPIPSMTFFNALLWTIVNFYGLIFLFLAFCSKETYRLYMWSAVALQLPFFAYLIVERVSRKAVDVDLLIPSILFILCVVHVLSIPRVLKIQKSTIEIHTQYVAEFATTRNLVLSLESDLNQPLTKDVRDASE